MHTSFFAHEASQDLRAEFNLGVFAIGLNRGQFDANHLEEMSDGAASATTIR